MNKLDEKHGFQEGEINGPIYWNFIFIGITFGTYIGIAIWSRAASTKEYYTASGSVSHLQTGWQLLLTGCQLQLLFLWQGDCRGRLRSLKIFNGLDRRLCPFDHFNGSIS